MYLYILLLVILVILVNGQNTTTPFTCIDSEKSCSNHGSCNDAKNACFCDNNYATYNCILNEQCCYGRNDQVTLLILQVIPLTGLLGFSFFILHRIELGLLTIILITGGFGLICCIGCCTSFCCKQNRVTDIEAQRQLQIRKKRDNNIGELL